MLYWPCYNGTILNIDSRPCGTDTDIFHTDYGNTMAIMAWLFTLIGHQQPWYWLRAMWIFLPHLMNYNNLWRFDVEELCKMLMNFIFSSERPIMARVKSKLAPVLMPSPKVFSGQREIIGVICWLSRASRDPFDKGLWSHKRNIVKILRVVILSLDTPFSTFIGSLAAMTYTKLWHNLVIIKTPHLWS